MCALWRAAPDRSTKIRKFHSDRNIFLIKTITQASIFHLTSALCDATKGPWCCSFVVLFAANTATHDRHDRDPSARQAALDRQVAAGGPSSAAEAAGDGRRESSGGWPTRRGPCATVAELNQEGPVARRPERRNPMWSRRSCRLRLCMMEAEALDFSRESFHTSRAEPSCTEPSRAPRLRRPGAGDRRGRAHAEQGEALAQRPLRSGCTNRKSGHTQRKSGHAQSKKPGTVVAVANRMIADISAGGGR